MASGKAFLRLETAVNILSNSLVSFFRKKPDGVDPGVNWATLPALSILSRDMFNDLESWMEKHTFEDKCFSASFDAKKMKRKLLSFTLS